ncbi:unnamed protein product [Mytilus coruscus]|uniref:NTR domain-containing protein n=1 Tax=Mytilus coruscus TaxID=42192 RepID=A0A6J8D4U5_MYTCO|nr:unnamed protein product [Mytilus coruscus]
MRVMLQLLTVMAVGYTAVSAGKTKCVCPGPYHPMTLFDFSDFCIKGTVKVKKQVWIDDAPHGKDLENKRHDNKYSVYVKKVLKGPCEKKTTMQIFSKGCTSYCGMNLKVGQTYLLCGTMIGNDYWINKCGFNKKWTKVTPHQHNAMQYRYRQQSGCMEKCQMNPKKPKHCYFNYATCQRKYYGYKYHKGIGYECDWYIGKGGGFKKCCDGKDPYYTR